MTDQSPARHQPVAKRLQELWQIHIVQSPAYLRILVGTAFLLTFLIVRGITYSIKYHWLPFLQNIQLSDGLHIHHLVWGILLLLLTGYLAIGFNLRSWRPWLAILYGIGAALTLDEFALWLNLEDVYWAQQGRESIDAVVIASTIFMLAILVQPFFRAVIGERRSLLHKEGQ